jgi:hypothetical protein
VIRVEELDALDAIEQATPRRPRLTVEALDALDAPARQTPPDLGTFPEYVPALAEPAPDQTTYEALRGEAATSRRRLGRVQLPTLQGQLAQLPSEVFQREGPPENIPEPAHLREQSVTTPSVLSPGQTMTPAERLARRLGRAAVHGVRTSAIGTTARSLETAPARVEEIPDEFVDRTISGLAGIATDLPVLVAGGTAGMLAARTAVRAGLTRMVDRFVAQGLTRPDAVVRASDTLIRAGKAIIGASTGAGSLGLEGVVKEAARQAVGESEGGPGKVVTEGAKGAALGGLTFGLASQVPQPVLRLLTEVGAFGLAGPPIHEGRLPTVQDLVESGVQLAAIHAAFRAAKLTPARVPGVEVVEPGTPAAAAAQRARRVGVGVSAGAAGDAAPGPAEPPIAEPPAARPMPGRPRPEPTPSAAPEILPPPAVQRVQDASQHAAEAVGRIEELARTAGEPPPLTLPVDVEALDKLDEPPARVGKVPEREAPSTPIAPPSRADEVSEQNLRRVRDDRLAESTAGALRMEHFLGKLASGGGESEPEAPSSDVERALTSTATKMAPRFRDSLLASYHGARRATTFEYDLRGFPLERDEIRVFHAQHRKALQKAGEDVIGIVGRLQDKGELEHFTRIVLLRDYRSRALAPDRFPGGVPAGLTVERIEAELERLEQSAPDRVRAALDAHARLMDAEREDLEARDLLDPEREIADYFPHFVLDFEGQRRTPGTGQRIQAPRRTFLRRAQGSERLIETDYIRAMFHHRSEIRFANAEDDFALSILGRHDRSGELDAATRKHLRPGQVVELDGEAYKAIQYRPGRSIFPVRTVEERALAEALTTGASRLEIDLTALGQRAALGRYFRVYLVPKPIAERFEHFAPAAADPIIKALNAATNRWKGITIGFWGQAGHLMNLLGDVMNLARTPGALAHLPRAVADVVQWKRGTGNDLVRLMEQYDVLDSGYVANEVYFRARAPELRQFLSHGEAMKQIAKDRIGGLLFGGAVGAFAGGPAGALAGASIGGILGARHYFKTLPETREALPRAAMARYQMGRLGRGLPLRPGGLDISGLEGTERGAMKIAREFTVDYGKFTPDENRLLRGLLLPFYAWAKTNTVNWLRFLWLVPLGGAAFLGLRLLLELWNNDDPDRRAVEQSLPPYKRNAAHIVTGWRDEDGKLIVVSWAGDPLADALGTVGLGGTPSRLSDLATGRLTLDRAVRQQFEAFVKEPGQRFTGLITPGLKVPVELTTGRTSFGFGQDIVPRELQGTSEAFLRQAQHFVESAFRPLRETRKLREEAGKAKGVDPLTQRFGLGLPFERVDVGEARERVAMQTWREGREEYIQAAITRLQDSPAYTKLPPHRQEILLRETARAAEAEFNRRIPAPVPRRERLRRRFAE